MKRKNYKLSKWLTALAAATVVSGTITTFVVTAAQSIDQKTSTKLDANLSATPKASITGDIIDNLVINVTDLSPAFANLYFSKLDFNDKSDPYAQNVINLLEAQLLKTPGYWNGIMPSNVHIRIDSAIINDNSNPNVSPGFCNAVKISILDPDDDLVDETVISLVGFKAITGQTYAINTFTNDLANKTNETASFVYAEPEFASSGEIIMPAANKVKDKLFENDSLILKTIFANLPDAENFKVTTDDVEVTPVSDFANPNGNFRYFDYNIKLNKTLLEDSTGNKVNTNPKTFKLQVYVPYSLTTYKDDSLKLIQTLMKTNIVSKKVVGITDTTASAFDYKRFTDKNEFISKIKEIIRINSEEYPPSLENSDIEINPTNVKSGSYIDDKQGVAVYTVTLKKVKVGGVEISNPNFFLKFDLYIGGFEKKVETKYFETISVQTIPELKDKFATQFVAEETQPDYDVNNDLMHTIANAGVTAYRSGSTYDTSSVTDAVAKKLFKAKEVSYNLAQAKYDDLTGSISGIRVTILGYYDSKGVLKELPTNTKTIDFNINGFKTSKATVPTRIGTIDVEEKYQGFPAQSYLAGTKADDSMNPMIETPATIPDDILSRIKDLIYFNVTNLPDTEDNADKVNWDITDLSINNFNGTITGNVIFPDIYITNDDGQNVVVHNKRLAVAKPEDNIIKTKFSIQGFALVPGATAVQNLKTNEIILESEFGYNEPIPASNLTWDEFTAKVSGIGNDKFNRNVVQYWATESIKIFDNKWDSFNEQFVIKEINHNSDNVNHVYTINFKSYIFDENGKYITSPEISISMSGFDGSIDPSKQVSSAISNPRVAVTSDSILSEFYYDEALKYIRYKHTGSDTPPPEYMRFMSSLLGFILEKMSENILRFETEVDGTFVKNTRLYIEDDTSIPAEKRVPGTLYLKLRFRQNYYYNGKLITVENDPNPLGEKWWHVEIYGFKSHGSSTITPIISVPVEGAESLSSDFANEATNRKAYIKGLIEANSANLVGSIDESVDFYWDPNSSVADTPFNAGGVKYFGIPNNINATLLVSYKFKANKWYLNGDLQTKDSEIQTVKITGFKKLDEAEINKIKWFKEEFEIDTTLFKKQLQGNAIASMIKEGDLHFSDKSKENLEKILKSRDGLITPDNYDSLSPIVDASLKVDYSKTMVDNTSGSAILYLSAQGAGIVNPHDGLPYEKAPFEFRVSIYGFDHVKPTKVINELTVDGLINDANASARQVKTLIVNNKYLNSLFNETLPKGFFSNSLKPGNDYIFLPPTLFKGSGSNSAPNIEADFINGSITIKQLALLYYYDDDNNLIIPDAEWETFSKQLDDWENGQLDEFYKFCYEEGTTPKGEQKFQYKVFENIKILGFKKVFETSFRTNVILNFPTLSPSEFINKFATDPEDSTTLQYNRLISKLIYNKSRKGSNSATNKPTTEADTDVAWYCPDLPPINNLPIFMDNYSNWADKEPIIRIDKSSGKTGVSYDNQKGTITLDLVATGNFFRFQGSNLVWKNLNKVPGEELKGTVVIQGFKSIYPTEVVNEVNINDLNTTTTSIFDYVEGVDYSSVSSGGPEILNKANLYELIVRNATKLIKNAYDIRSLTEIDLEDVKGDDLINEVEKYLKVTVASDGGVIKKAADFSNGKVTISIQLRKYYDKDGNVVDLETDPSQVTLDKTIEIYGFNSYESTRQLTNIINLNNEINTPWENLPFFCSEEQIEQTIMEMGVNPMTGNLNFVSRNIENLPPNLKFDKFGFDQNLKVKKVTRVEPPAETLPEKFKLRFELEVKNAIVPTMINGKSINSYGTVTLPFEIISWQGRTQTKINDIWPLKNIDRTLFSWTEFFANDKTDVDKVAYIQRLLDTDEMWLTHCKNAKGPGGQKSKFFVKKINSVNPADASNSMNITVTLQGYYDEHLQWQAGELPEQEVTLQNLPVQSGTYVSLGKVIPVDKFANPLVNFLPSKFIKTEKDGASPETKAEVTEFINYLNNADDLNNQGHGNLRIIPDIFTNPYLNKGGENTKIIDYDLIAYDDRNGTASIKLSYINYYNEKGELILGEDRPFWSNVITFTGFAVGIPTAIGNTFVDISNYFINSDGTTNIPEDIGSLTPNQFVDEIERKVLSSTNQTEMFKEYVLKIIQPLFSARDEEWNPSDKLAFGNSWENISPDSTTVKQKIIMSGEKRGQVKGSMNTGTGSTSPGSGDYPKEIQNISGPNGIKIKFVPGEITDESGDKPVIDIRKTFDANDRLGTLGFKIKVAGFWKIVDDWRYSGSKLEIPTLALDSSGDLLDENGDKASADAEITITITGMKKNVEVETKSASLILICSSIAAGLVTVILLVAFIIKLKKFGIA